jgi:hypothetical protein
MEKEMKEKLPPAVYEIRVKSHISRQWMDSFEGLTFFFEENGDTLMTGRVADQAALHRVFRLIRDLGMVLISVNRIQE